MLQHHHHHKSSLYTQTLDGRCSRFFLRVRKSPRRLLHKSTTRRVNHFTRSTLPWHNQLTKPCPPVRQCGFPLLQIIAACQLNVQKYLILLREHPTCKCLLHKVWLTLCVTRVHHHQRLQHYLLIWLLPGTITCLQLQGQVESSVCHNCHEHLKIVGTREACLVRVHVRIREQNFNNRSMIPQTRSAQQSIVVSSRFKALVTHEQLDDIRVTQC